MFRRSVSPLALALLLAVGIGACGGEGTAAVLKAALTPAEEVPGPGVKDGVGTALVDIAGPKVCSDLKVTMGEKPLKAHVHKGAKGASGPVVVDLMPAFNPGEAAYTSNTCVETTADTAAQLIADPAGYYVNIHSDAHPDGAMRGQLAK